MKIKSFVSVTAFVLTIVPATQALAEEMLNGSWTSSSTRGEAMTHLVNDQDKAQSGEKYWSMDGENGLDSRQQLSQDIAIPAGCSAYGLGVMHAIAWYAGVDETDGNELDQAKLTVKYSKGKDFITQASTDWATTEKDGNYKWQELELTDIAIPEGTSNLRIIGMGKPIGADDTSVDVAWDGFSLIRNCVADYTKISGVTNIGKGAHSKSVKLSGIVATLEDGSTNGKISINYQSLHTVCEFKPEGISYSDGKALVATTYECSNDKFGGGNATITLDMDTHSENLLAIEEKQNQINVLTDDADLDIADAVLVNADIAIMPGQSHHIDVAMSTN